MLQMQNGWVHVIGSGREGVKERASAASGRAAAGKLEQSLKVNSRGGGGVWKAGDVILYSDANNIPEDI